MASDVSMSDAFFLELARVVEVNMGDEHFGANELANEVGLSRSHIHRKLKSAIGKSTSQFIREIRLRRAHELLEDRVGTASEIAYKVGFNSSTYFTKCFHDFYGYPPGSVKTLGSNLEQIQNKEEGYFNLPSRKIFWKKILLAIPLLLILFLVYTLLPNDNNVRYDGETKSSIGVTEERPNSVSVVILPFKNLSINEEDQILADAVLEQINKHLQRISLSEINLRSRTSAERYRNTTKSVVEIGKELEVDYIIQASFQKIGDTADLTVQLINARTDEHVWVEEYRRNWKDIFIVQTEVAKKVADKLSATFSETALEAIAAEPTNNMEAYRYYLMGLHAFRLYWRRNDTLQLAASEQQFKKALELDKNFSYAHTGLAKVNMLRASLSDGSNRKTLLNAARNYLEKAINLDRYNGWAFSELGAFEWQWQWDSIAARKNFNTALLLEPNNSSIYDNYFQFEYKLGNCKKIKHLLQRLISINPYYRKPYHVYQLKVLDCQNNYKEMANLADEYWNDKYYSVVYTRLFCRGYLYNKNYEKARELVNHLKEISRRNNQQFGLLARLSAAEGDTTSTLAYIDSLSQLSKKQYVAKVYIATLYSVVGDNDNMYKNLDLALANREREILYLMNNDLFIPYQKEKRFQEIWAKAWVPKSLSD